MTITMPCKRCGVTISADDEDDLVTKVQIHARTDHNLRHDLPRKHILAHLHAQKTGRSGAGRGPRWAA